MTRSESPEGTPSLRDEDYFRELADGVPVLIWMAGLDMGCFYFNRAWLDFRGRTLEQEQGNGWAEGVHPEDVQRCVRHYIGCFEHRSPFAMSYRLKNRAGEYRWILDRGAPHFGLDGTFLGFFGGCAETGGDKAIERIGQLRTSLSTMGEFARQRASAELPGMNAGKGPTDKLSLESVARARHGSHMAQLHAAAQIGRLADDMLTYGRIDDGACLVDAGSKPLS
jgi:PAS domain S-box-containing protein